MGEFVYTTVPGKVKELLSKIRGVGIPPKVTNQWLKTIGFTSSNDGSLIGVLKFIGFVDASNVPTTNWAQFRGADYKRVLGAAIREGYAELFAVYPDAQQRNQTELDHVFSTSSSGGKQVVAKTISTFKSLVDEAEFQPIGEQVGLQLHAGPLHTPPAPTIQNVPKSLPASSGPSLHIDVQIHISPEASADQIDQVFASMSKHLYGAKNTD